MKLHLRIRHACGSVVVLAAYACGSDAGGDSLVDTGGSGPTTLVDASVTPHDAGPPKSIMRLAHLASDVAPIDFCWQTARAGTFEGPMLGGQFSIDAGDDAEAGDAGDAGDDGGTLGLGYREVSRYVTLEGSGPLTIAIVPAGKPCGASLVVADVTLDPGKLTTVMLSGSQGSDAGDQLALGSFTDDRTTTRESARVRIIHAALGPDAVPIAVRASSGTTVDLAARVEPRKATTPSDVIDGLGYATVSPLPSPATISVSPAAAGEAGAAPGWQSMGANLDLHGDSLHTGFVLNGEGTPYQVLWCSDTTTTGDRTSCSILR